MAGLHCRNFAALLLYFSPSAAGSRKGPDRTVASRSSSRFFPGAVGQNPLRRAVEHFELHPVQVFNRRHEMKVLGQFINEIESDREIKMRRSWSGELVEGVEDRLPPGNRLFVPLAELVIQVAGARARAYQLQWMAQDGGVADGVASTSELAPGIELFDSRATGRRRGRFVPGPSRSFLLLAGC
jgi:hypothetical protein